MIGGNFMWLIFFMSVDNVYLSKDAWYFKIGSCETEVCYYGWAISCEYLK